MPLTEAGAALIATGAAVAGQGAQVVTSGKMNKKARFHALRMYERQLADNKEIWDLQNKYNSPAEQMKRLKEAGLNPNLVYGDGATTTADSIHTGSMNNPQQFEPDVASIGKSVGDGLANYYDLRMKNAQISNVEQQGKNLKLDADLKAQELGANQFQLERDRGLYPGSLQAQELGNRQRQQTLDLNERKDIRSALASTASLSAAAEKLLRDKALRTKTDPLQRRMLSAQIANLGEDIELKQIERKLNARGLTKSDPAYVKALATWWQDNNPAKNLNSEWKGDPLGRFTDNLPNWYPPAMLGKYIFGKKK